MTLSERQTAIQADRDATRLLFERAMQAAREAELQIVRFDAQLALVAELLQESPHG